MNFDMNNLGGLMAGLQQRLTQARAEAASATVEGQAGGGLVTVVATGEQVITAVKISPDAYEDREFLEDLIQAATNDAIRKGKELMAKKLEAVTGGLPLPPGLI